MARGSNMDPTHHAKIVDKLMQYRGKIPKGGSLATPEATYYSEEMRKHIDFLLQQIDWYADCFEKGLIR